MVLGEVRLWNGQNNEGEGADDGPKAPELMVLKLILDAIYKEHQPSNDLSSMPFTIVYINDYHT